MSAMSPARLSRSTLAGLPAPVARPGYDVGAIGIGIVHLGLGSFHRAHEAVYTDAILRGDPRWGICGVSLQDAAGDRRARAAGRAVLGARQERRRDVGAGDRVGARNALPRHGAGSRAGADRRSFGPGRVADRHREGLLPRSGDGAPQPRCIPTSRTISAPRGALEHDRRAGGGPRRAARRGRRRDQRRLLRQPSAQRAHGRGHRRGVRAGARAGARRLDRRARRLSVHDGGPHRPGDHGGRPRRGRAPARCRRRGAGRRRALQQLGDREPLRARPAPPGRKPARRSSPTSRRSRR